MIDYIEKLGGAIREEPNWCRILCQDQNAVFSHIEPDDLRQKFNAAMAGAVVHYARNAKLCGVEISEQEIEEVAFRVVLRALYVYNLWRHTYQQHRNHPLRVEAADLSRVDAYDQCWFYCQKEFGKDYAIYAAALTGMSLEEFAKYERGRRAFCDR